MIRCICFTTGQGPEGCGLCNETGWRKPAPGDAAAERLANCSVRARRLFARLCRGAWYPVYPTSGRTPKAMQELIDAKLVTVMARAKVIEVCYAPRSARQGKPERFPATVSEAVGLPPPVDTKP